MTTLFISRTHTVSSLFLLGLLAMPTAVWAEDITDDNIPDGFAIAPILSQSGVWDSNPLLLLNGAQSLYGSVTSPEIIITDRTPTKMLKLDNRVDENLFNLSNFNSTDFHSKDKFITRSESWAAGLTGTFDYDTTRSSEVTVFGFNTTPVRHQQYSVTPELSFNSTPRDKYDITGTFLQSTYATSVFTNYDQYSVTPSYTHKFTPLASGLFNINAQRYKATQGPQSVTDTIGPSIGWIQTLTPRLSAQATVGAQMTRQYQAALPTKAWQTDYIFSGDLTFNGESDKTDLTVGRSSKPFGNGTESLLTQIGLKDEHVLNKNFSVNVGANYEVAEYQQETTNNLESLAQANGGLTYHATEQLDITGSYQYRYETLVNVSKAPDDHTVSLQLVLHPNAWTF